MSAIVAHCGFRCDQCPAFIKISRTKNDRIAAAAGWAKFFNLKVKPESLRCKGCLAGVCAGFDYPSENCRIRLCAIERKLENCAGCADYPCEKLGMQMKSVEKRIRRFKGKVPKKAYDRFLAPYDARATLVSLRPGGIR